MGVVYKARDPVLGREVAVKLIPPGNLTKDAEERFLREAQIIAQMDHPAIVPIYDLGRHEGSLFFVMPVLPGTNLRHLLRDGSLRLGDVLDIGTQVAEALDYSHGRGIVHRDIKPENIMTAREDGGHVRARVMDFGLALATTEDRLTKTGTLVGTVSYFSPEQVTSKSFDGRTDIYALGTVLYESLAGEPPFSGEVQAVLYRVVHEVPQSLRALGADIGDELEGAILQCLEKDPEKRPRRAGHLAEALRRYRGKLHEDDYTRSVVLTASRMIARPQAAGSPFIGREKEITELQRRLHAAVGGECQLAVVAGEPGIGKTRLVEELVTLARARKIRVLHGRFVEQDRAFAHQGFCELIQDYFRGKDTSSSMSRPDLSDLAGDLVSLFPVLSEIGELRAAATGDSGEARAVKAEDRTAVFELLARTLTRIAQGKPLVLVLEELHGAEQSVEALQYVVRRMGPTQTLVVGSYRPSEIGKAHPLLKMLESFRGDPRFLSLTLEPFSSGEHRSLVESMAGGRVADRLARRLYEATEGNPLFTKEVLRSLVESGGVAADDSGALNLSGATGPSSDALPATIQEAVQKRFQRLAPELRDLASLASILGKAFEFRDLESLADGAADLEDTVEKLIGEGVLEEERESRSDRLEFASGIARDYLYGALPKRKRRSLHRKYAEALEKRQASRLERVYPDLVHHFSQGDVPGKTVDYAIKLARKSLDSFSPDEAVRVARIALDYLADEGWEGDRALEGETRLLLAEAHRMAGDVDAALLETEQAARILEAEKQQERSVEAVLYAAEIAWQSRRVEDTRRWVERGVSSARKLTSTRLLERLLSLAATVANLRGDYQKAGTLLAEIERLASRERPEKTEAARGGRLVVGFANPLTAAEPARSGTVEEQEVLGNVFETLVTADARGTLVPFLCESWSLVDGARTARLSLRTDVTFSDGAPLTAAAVKASFERAIQVRRHEVPAALATIQGVSAFLDAGAPDVAGIAALSEHLLEVRLDDELPIFAALLTDVTTAIARVGEGGQVVGTGPFRLASLTPQRLLLERNAGYWKGEPPPLDAVELRPSLSSAAMAAGLREGRLEIGRDLSPSDLDDLLREPRLRAGLVETPKRGTYFVLFNTSSALGGSAALRKALSGITRSQDFVWGAAGRFAMPAVGLIPPGILGHDAGRRHETLSGEAAAELLRSSGLPSPLRLKASVHPLLQDRFRALTAALLGIWRQLGVEVETVTATMAEYLDAQNGEVVDVEIGRWNADYDDPDDFTFALFHSGNGHLRHFYSSPETDQLLALARRESRPATREALYRAFEEKLLSEGVVIPLFHEIDYRVAAPGVRGLSLRGAAPYVSYAELSKSESAAPAASSEHEPTEGVVHVPIPGTIESLDPVVCETHEMAEVLPNVFETLTRDLGARVVPWLASEFTAEEGGTRYRFRLRPGVRFHDGRRLTARDVRYSFERLLLDRRSSSRFLLAPIRGATALLDGNATDLAGLQIVSPSELVITLEKPVAFFPVLLTYSATAILPEGTTEVGRHWREGCVGTGPFRSVEFEPGRRLELERNPHYWRAGFPKSEGLVFRFGMTPAEIKSEFLAGRLSLASDLLPADADALRLDPHFAALYRESPSLVTYFVAFNIHSGPFRDASLRRAVAERWNASGAVQRILGRLAIPAKGLIPPGLLGSSATQAGGPAPAESPAQHTVPKERTEVTASVHPIYFGEYAAFGKELLRGLDEMGFSVKVVNRTMGEYLDNQRLGTADLSVGRWIADFPDADTFVYLLHTEAGTNGRHCGTPEIDRLAEQGRAEMDPRTRHSIYRQVEEIIARDALLVPLFHEQVYRFARPEIEGLTVGFSLPTVAYDNLAVRQ